MKEFLEADEKELLLDIFHIYSPTNGEASLSLFLANFLEKNGIDFVMDQYNNIYSMKYPGEPILCAHQDCVGDALCGSLVEFIDIYDLDGEKILKGNGNIGADDKIGIFLILLYMLKVNKNINFVFSTGEEHSVATGIKTVVNNIKDTDGFKKAPYCIVLDRKNGGDIICEKNSFGSKTFDEALEKIGLKYGFVSVRGGMSDTATFADYMNAANLSVGYYNPHTKTEYVVISEMLNTFDYVCDLIENLDRTIPFEEKKTTTTYPAYSGYNKYGGNSYDDDLYGGSWNGYGAYGGGNYGNNYGGKKKDEVKPAGSQKGYYYANDYEELYD
jgi:putative aminopeptidase FrvX